MAKVSPQRAAELTGRSKSTIVRAMTTGKVSFEVEEGGRRVLDTAELERAFGLLPQNNDAVAQGNLDKELAKAQQQLELERLKMRVKMLEEQLEAAQEQVTDLRVQRDQWQKQAQQVLLTSQYSQKQAEDLQAELKERDRRAQARRQQELERRMQLLKGGNENKPEEDTTNFDLQALWGKIRGKKTG